MVNILKLNNDNIFFYSDIHGKHGKDFILKPRGFSTPDEALDTLISNWNSIVTNNDICFLLGDTVVGAGPDGEKVFQEIISRLNCKEIYIMPGNHFSGFSALFNRYLDMDYTIDRYYRLSIPIPSQDKIIHLIPNYYEIYVKNQFIILNHYPILSFNGQSKNSIHIYGHCHNNLIKSNIGKEYVKGRVLEVSPESVGNFPLSFADIMLKIGSRVAIKTDHHDKNTT